ncbi:unnamed protein product [Boreogadus saida]
MIFSLGCWLSVCWQVEDAPTFPLGLTPQTFTGGDIRFEAVDDTGVHPITEQYAAECGYSVNVRPHLGFAELRASYFSCTALNEDDETFTFSFNMIVTQDGVEETYDVNKTWRPTM